MTRKLPDWIDGFSQYTSDLSTPPIFSLWAAITTIAGALERKVWIRSQGSDLFPNIYTILVAPPGIGKSQATKRAELLWRGLPDQFVAGNSLSRASLIDELKDAERRVVFPRGNPPTLSFNSTKILVNELGVLFPTYDMEFMAVLTDIYDGTPYNERKRSHKDGPIKIEHPQFTILGATTPSHLHSFLPEGAWDQGFLSRTFLIYSDDRRITPLFEESKNNLELYKALQQDLRRIAVAMGPMEFELAAAKAVTAWHMQNNPPRPEHPKLQHYNSRRTLHLLKLCMISSMSSSEDKVITLAHYERALSWLLAAEKEMVHIFQAMKSGGDGKAIEECYYHVKNLYGLTKQPVPETKLVLFLQERVPAYNVTNVLTVMEKAGLFTVTTRGRVRAYTPIE